MARKRSALAVAGLAVTALLIFGPARADTQNPRTAQLYTEKLKALHHEGAKLGYRLWEIQVSTDALRSGKVDAEEFDRTYDSAIAELSEDIREYRRGFPADIDPPPSASSEQADSMQAFADMMVHLPDWLDAMQNVTSELRAAAQSGNESAFDRGLADAFDFKANLALTRNAMLKNGLYQSDPDRPEYLAPITLWLTGATIATNMAEAAGIKTVARTHRNDSFDEESHLRRAELALRQAEEAVSESEEAGRQLLQRAENGELPDDQVFKVKFYVSFFGLDAARSRKRIDATRLFIDTIRTAASGDPSSAKAAMRAAVTELDAAGQRGIADMIEPTRRLFGDVKQKTGPE